MDDIFTKVERAKKEWESTIDALPEGVALYKSNSLEIRRANWSLASFMNTTPQQMVGVNIHGLLCNCSIPECELLALLHSTKPASKEIWREYSSQLWLVSTQIISDMFNQELSTVIVIRDITQERAMQKYIIETEKKAAILQVAAGLAEQITPSIRYDLHYLNMLSKHVNELRSALCDYRIAMTKQEDSQTLVSSYNWETIESRYNVEFILQDIDQAIEITQSDLRRIFSTICHLSHLEDSEPLVQKGELHQIIDELPGFSKDKIGEDVSLADSFNQYSKSLRCNSE